MSGYRGMGRWGIFLATALLLLVCGPLVAAADETVCLQCHGAQEGRLGAPVDEWRGSVHAANGISCHDCHGGDPKDMALAMSPEKGFLGAPDYDQVPDFCGRCHVGVKEDYLASKHGRALQSGGPQCVICHTNHAVRKASIELINPTSCSRCHEYDRAAEIRGAMEKTEARIVGEEQRLEPLARIGIRIKTFEGEIFSLRNNFHRLFHTVDVDKVRKSTAGFGNQLDGISTRIDAIEGELSGRKLWGGVAILLLVAAGLLFWLLRRTYHDEERSGHD